MPYAAPKPCVVCRTLVRDGTTRCAAHKVKPGSFADKRRGTSTERGYGAAWRRVRERIMRRDGGVCRCAASARPTRSTTSSRRRRAARTMTTTCRPSTASATRRRPRVRRPRAGAERCTRTATHHRPAPARRPPGGLRKGSPARGAAPAPAATARPMLGPSRAWCYSGRALPKAGSGVTARKARRAAASRAAFSLRVIVWCPFLWRPGRGHLWVRRCLASGLSTPLWAATLV
jgi:hypothetical protein